MAKPSKHIAALLPATDAPEDDSFEFEEQDEGVLVAEEEAPPEPAPKPQKRTKPAKTEPVVEAATEEPVTEEEPEIDRVRRENAELKAEQARRAERVALLREIQAENQRQRQQNEEQERVRAEQERRAAERPDPLIDPVGAHTWDLDQKIQVLEQRLEQMSTQDQQRTAVSREQQVWDYTNNDFRFARGRYNDFDQAIEFLRNGELRQLQAVGLLPREIQTQADLDKANGFIQQKLFFFAQSAAQNGLSIADLLYNEAKAQGYQGPKPVTQTQQTAKAAAQGQNRIAALQKGQKLQGLGGKQAAASIDNEEFDFADFLDNASEAQIIEFLSDPKNAAYAEQQLAILERGTVH